MLLIAFTFRLEQSGNSELLLSEVKRPLQVFPVAVGLRLREVHQIRSKGAENGQKHLTTPPAGLKVPHTGWATDSGGRKQSF